MQSKMVQKNARSYPKIMVTEDIEYSPNSRSGFYAVLFHSVGKGTVIYIKNRMFPKIGCYAEDWDMDRFRDTDDKFLLSNNLKESQQ